MTNVTIYTTPTCQYCKMAKEYFKENEVEYKAVDVSEDQEGQEAMVKKSGQMGVPVIVVEKDGKEEVIVGFDKPKLDSLLS